MDNFTHGFERLALFLDTRFRRKLSDEDLVEIRKTVRGLLCAASISATFAVLTLLHLMLAHRLLAAG
jgi:hypothetical protein